MATGKFIAYYRVSTDKQGKSGLGLEAQRKSVLSYLNGGDWELEREFTEVESGKRNTRPQLAAAIEECRKTKSTLIIAKLDRLARNVHFISGLMESGVDFVAADNPHANKLMLHMLAAFAEHEREQISERTKSALAAAKSRGVKLGKNGAKLAEKNKADAHEFAMSVRGTINEIRARGFTTMRAIRDELNQRDIPAPRGGKWHIPTLLRVLSKLDAR